MYSYEELEKIYYQRKIKKFLLFLFIFVFIGGVFYLLYPKKKVTISDINLTKPSKVKKQPNVVKDIVKIKFKKIEKKDKNSSKKLVLHFVLPDLSSEEKKDKNVSATQNLVKPKSKEINVTKPKAVKPKASFPVITSKSVTLNALIKSYESFPTLQKAIQIAEIYLQKNSLKEAQKWALKANDIDPSNYKSWIIFAKILIKEGKIKNAKKILNTYIENYGNNDQIDKFLRSIK